MRRLLTATVAGAAFLAAATVASGGHGLEQLTLDHPVVATGPTVPGPTPEPNSAPAGAWERVATVATANPHTDIDFFTQRGEIYAGVGTLAAGLNGGGQTIVKLTRNGQVTPTSPMFVSAHGSAACLSDPTQATGLQHDIEAAPKGNVILNTSWPFSVRKDAQILVDTSDNPGRCHDQGIGGVLGRPQGGLEIIDITDINHPIEIGLTSHIVEAHTVNVDPKRPWIAYAVTSDAITVNADGQRNNEVPASGDRLDLDGFEVVDMSSCMNFPMGTTLDAKRARCRPKVYRYRYPTKEMALGTRLQTGGEAIFGCHELEVYPDDRLACASGNAAMHFDMSGAFDKNGKPKGTPLPCSVRDSSSPFPYAKPRAAGGVAVTDCVVGKDGQNLDVPSWLAMNPRPSLAGVRWLGSAHHMGRGASGTGTDSNEDIDFDHELERSASGRLLIATDERGGGVAPPGAACTTSPGTPSDNKRGNGGLHFYRVNQLDTTLPGSQADAWDAYARTQTPPPGAVDDRAIYRVPINTGPQGSLCTAHVFHQIPGQNRIFMGWYSQGTQVIDFIEHPNGKVSFIQRGHFIPANANEWVSAVFKVKQNPGGSYTYWGATAEFGTRNEINIYRVTLPAPPRPFGEDEGCPPNDDDDADGLINSRELLLFTLLGNPDSDLDGIKDGNDDANDNGQDDEDEDDNDGCPDRDGDGDGVDDEDEDD
jgi:hypothetical protein